MNSKPTAVVRREIVSNTAPSFAGFSRMDKARSPKGEIFIFLGVCDGVAHVEREDKTKGAAFEEIDSDVFRNWKKI